MLIRRSCLLLTALAAGLPTLSYANDDLRTQVIAHNAALTYAVYSDTLSTAKQLEQAIAQLVAQPSEANLLAARQAWLAAREPYGQSEVFRFQGGPIDDLDDSGKLEAGKGPEPRINAWPLDEALIDYVAKNVDGNARNEDQPKTSFVQDLKFAISPDSLAAANEYKGNEANVATGYHAIEFLLWGQDLNQGQSSWDGKALRDTSAGQRPYTDYVAGKGCTSGLNKPDKAEVCKRRGDYLQAVSALLVRDLTHVTQAWAPEQDNYRAQFVKAEQAEQSLLKILLGMGSLSYGELAGERLMVALAAGSQEDEQSCFSDNTHRDLFTDALGIQNVYLGRYTQVDGKQLQGPSVKDLLSSKDSALADTLAQQLEATMQAAAVVDAKAKAGTPFDKLVEQFPGKDSEGRTVRNANLANNVLVHNAVEALQAQTASIEAAAKALLGEVQFEVEGSAALQ